MPAKRRRVIWAPRAKRDLTDIWGYYARVASVDVANKLLREIDATARRLSDDALRWRARDEIMRGLRSALVHPYVIFYRVNNEAVEIARVLRGRRNFAAIFPKEERDDPG
jgi:toxin ParE1/3/4